MKSTYIVFALLLGSLLQSCSNGNTGNTVNNDVPAQDDLILLASNFRSEAAIIVDSQDEEWIGKFDNMTLVDYIFEKIYDSTLTPYDLLNNILAIEDIKLIEYSLDTIMMENFETGKLYETVVEESLARDEITKIFLREDWYFDKENFNIKKEVVSITLTTKKYDLQGDFLGFRVLFVVYMNGKEPEAASNLVN